MMVTTEVQITVILLLAQTICTVNSFKCFVCAPDEGKPEDMYTLRKSFPSHNIQACSQYNKHNKDQYLLECPNGGSSGCLTKFEANGSVMRNCAPIAIEDCKEANGINYCYCKTEGCNSPERRLNDPHHQSHQSHGSSHGQHANIGHSQAAARTSVSDKSFTHYFDEEEGSGEWGDFYYDDYNYHSKEEYYPAADIDDTEHDGYDGAHDNSDITEPPPFIDQESGHADRGGGNRHKYDREPQLPYHPPHINNQDITIEDEVTTRGPKPSSATSAFSSSLATLLIVSLIFVTEILVRS